MPVPVSTSVSLSTSDVTEALVAPSASRMPISRVRRAVEKAITP